jgi:hypothetical protein
MMRRCRGALVVGLLGVQLAACAPTISGSGAVEPASASGAGATAGGGAVGVRVDVSGRFIALVGPKVQHDPLYLDTPNTNYSCLRSFIDQQTGETAHQLYVAASYESIHDWDTARDGSGRTLVFLPINRFKIACNGKEDCAYAEEFAAKIPEGELNENTRGFNVTFADRAGHSQVFAVSSQQVAAQVAALAEEQKKLRSAQAATPFAALTAPPSAAAAPAHQP